MLVYSSNRFLFQLFSHSCSQFKKSFYICPNKNKETMLPTTSKINGIEVKAMEIASYAYDSMKICKGDKVFAINTSIYFLTGEEDYSKHSKFKTSAFIYLNELIKETK